MLPFEQQLEQSWPLRRWQDVTIIVAVSGGPDSVALLRALVHNRTGGAGRILVGHFNHQWRANASGADQAFVEKLARQWNLPVHIGRAERERQQEDEARQDRYAFLHELAQATGARHIVTAHTADDQAETILHRILRGTGIAGLAGIPRTRRLDDMTVILRPLLEATRTQILKYLDQLEQAYCQDGSNDDVRFTRNRIRHELIPQLQTQYNQHVVQAVLRLGSLAHAGQRIIDREVGVVYQQSIRVDQPQRVEFDCVSLRQHDSFLLCELFMSIWRAHDWPQQEMGHRRWSELALLAQSSGGHATLTLPAGIRCVREANRLRVWLTDMPASHT